MTGRRIRPLCLAQRKYHEPPEPAAWNVACPAGDTDSRTAAAVPARRVVQRDVRMVPPEVVRYLNEAARLPVDPPHDEADQPAGVSDAAEPAARSQVDGVRQHEAGGVEG